MRRTFRYRLYPTRTQDSALHAQVDEACRLYNAALDERRSAWRMRGLKLNYYTQSRQLKAIRAAGDCCVANFSTCQDVLRRVDGAFADFFRRLKRGERPGYPRFKPRQRYDSLTWASWGSGCALRSNGRLYLQGAGEIKVKWHRPLPVNARIKTSTIKREAGHWYVCFSLELADPQPLPECSDAVGIDVGLTSFLVTDSGRAVANPRHFRLAERALRRAQRKLARRQKRSRRREQARLHVARLHAHIANQRRDFHHKTANWLATTYGRIAIENLNVRGLAASRLAKSVHDAGWSQFLCILADKAGNAGRQLVAVNPAGTTQRCSACGAHVPKTLADRWHDCPACGLSLSRDQNAARNILQLGERLGWSPQAPTVEGAHAVA
jgi:putative transposase